MSASSSFLHNFDNLLVYIQKTLGSVAGFGGRPLWWELHGQRLALLLQPFVGSMFDSQIAQLWRKVERKKTKGSEDNLSPWFIPTACNLRLRNVPKYIMRVKYCPANYAFY